MTENFTSNSYAVITVFTPAYNRAHVLHRAYESLKAQSFRDFEWIIVDDGSSDDTEAVVQAFMAQDNFFPIRYFYQENQGKHNATNRAVQEANGEFFVTLDSDDGCKPEALERFMAVWNTIPQEMRHQYKGVSCRCCTPDAPETIIGTPLPVGENNWLDSHDLDLRYRHKVKGELWGMSRRDVLLENPYPAIRGLHYYPEGAYWGNIGLRYRTRYFNEPLRYYYIDGTAMENQLTKRVNAKETFYIREFMLSERVLRQYFWCDPVNFWMQAVGFVRDGLLTDRSVKDLFAKAGSTKRGKILFALGFLPGKMLQLREKRKKRNIR